MPKRVKPDQGEESDVITGSDSSVLLYKEKISITEEQDELKKAYAYAIRLLTRREYSYQELNKKLCTNFSKEVSQSAVQRCKDEGWQSEERYGEMLVRHVQLKGHGPLMFRLKARKAGLSESIVTEFTEQTDWLTVAKSYLRKKIGSDVPTSYQQRIKLLKELQRRGFPSSISISALNGYE